MKLINIHSRRDFIKINELFGGTSGGPVAGGQGFANNASLKDTYLGDLVNGIFKGISWLWRKSKENFIINKLKAQLINELTRGVIIYCFDSNINIETGKIVKGEEEGGESTNEEKDEFEVIKMDKTSGTTFLENFDPINPSAEIIAILADPANNIAIDFDKLNAAKPEDIEQDERDLIQEEEEINHDFLLRYVENFESMNLDQKQKIKIIYINYMMIKKLNEKLKIVVNDSKKNSINYKNYNINEAIAKIKQENPKAGDVSLGKSLIGLTVSDILTSRDRKQYENNPSVFENTEEGKVYTKKDKDFKLDIYAINLAEIEKTIQTHGGEALKNVSKRVNSENLKVIQLTAKELFVPKEGQDKSKVQLRWNKEVSSIYANFTNIMDISLVDIREDFRNDLTGAASTKSKSAGNILKSNENLLLIADRFEDAIEKDESKASELNGSWSYFGFTYNGKPFISSVAPVNLYKRDYHLFMIANTFTNSDSASHTVTSNFTEFEDIFKSKMLNGSMLDKMNVNVYFMFFTKTYPKFPTGDSKSQPNAILVFNSVYNTADQTTKLYVCKKDSGGKFSIVNEVESMDSGDFKNYKVLIGVDTCRKFVPGTKFEPWMNSLKLNNRASKKSPQFNDFIQANVPHFYTDHTGLHNKIREIKLNAS